MSTFREVIKARAAVVRARQDADRETAAAEERADREAGARRAVPFQAAEATLQAIMDRDEEFRKYMQEQVDFKNMVPDSGIDVPKHDSWCLAVIVKEGRVKLMLNDYTVLSVTNPAEAPAVVCENLRPILEILQDETKVFGFLLDKYGTPEENLDPKR